MKLSTRKQIAVAMPLIVAGVTMGCGRRPQIAAGTSALQERAVPFHSQLGSRKRPGGLALSLADIGSETPILVRLETSLSSAHAVAGDSFEAVLDAPLIYRAQTLAPKGSRLHGKVLEAKPSEPSREAGYLRLALTGITLNGKTFPLQTANIFVKGATYEREAAILPVELASASKNLVPATALRPQRIVVRDDAGIPTARLLTFRLTQPVTLANGGQ